MIKQFGSRLGCLFLFSLLSACPDAAFAVDRHLTPAPNASAAVPPLKLAIAGGSLYTTDIGLSALPDATASVNVSVDGCQQGTMTVKTSGSRYLEDVTSSLLCVRPWSYYLIDTPAQVRSFTMLSFHNGASRTSFKMPALGAVSPGSPSTIGTAETLTNTDHNQTRVLCGFPGSEGRVDVEVHGSDAELLAIEQVDCYAPITLKPLATKFPSGYVVVKSVPGVQVGCPGCTQDNGAVIYGAVVVSSADAGNARVYPFGDSGAH